jgi:hypothetical protein
LDFLLWIVIFANETLKKLILRTQKPFKGLFLVWLKSSPEKKPASAPSIKGSCQKQSKEPGISACFLIRQNKSKKNTDKKIRAQPVFFVVQNRLPPNYRCRQWLF